jgi:hypothetical protein
VAADQAGLQPGAQVTGDVPGGQRPESGRHAVMRLDVIGQDLDHLAPLPDPGQHLLRQFDAGVMTGHSDDIAERQRPNPDRDAPGLAPRPGRQDRLGHLVLRHFLLLHQAGAEPASADVASKNLLQASCMKVTGGEAGVLITAVFDRVNMCRSCR